MEPNNKNSEPASPAKVPDRKRTPLADELLASDEELQSGTVTGRDWDAEEAVDEPEIESTEPGIRPDPILVDPTEDRE